MNLDDFIEEEKEGVIFCKIGKSSQKMLGKGGYFPYRDYIGKIINLSDGDITFERLDDVVKYLHYGDDLVVFSFLEGKNKLPQEGYVDNILNKGCYNTKSIYVKYVLSFNNADTVNFIYNNLKDKSNFFNHANIAKFHLRDRGLLDSAQRWEELVNIGNGLNNKGNVEEKHNNFLDNIIRWLKKDNNLHKSK